MNSIRTTNILLLIIAASLITIITKQLSNTIISDAQAGYPIEFQNIVLYGCYKPNGALGSCQNKPIAIDESGRLIISPIRQ